MQKRIYILDCDNHLKLAYGTTQEEAIDNYLNRKGGHPTPPVYILYETNICLNYVDVLRLCGIEFSAVAVDAVFDWFKMDKAKAMLIVRDVFRATAITRPELPNIDYTEKTREFTRLVAPQLLNCKKGTMFNISLLVPAVDEYRATQKLGFKQLGHFFVLDSTRRAILEQCIKRNRVLSQVKRREFNGPGYPQAMMVSLKILNLYLQWVSQVPHITLEEITRRHEAKQKGNVS